MKLNEILKTKGLSVRKLSEMCGVSCRTLELYTSGRRDIGNAAARTVLKIADILNVHPKELIDEAAE